jgi:hypothetical protein
VLSYLGEENAYTAAAMADTQQLQDELYKEMRARIQEADTSVATRWGLCLASLDGDVCFIAEDEGELYCASRCHVVACVNVEGREEHQACLARPSDASKTACLKQGGR